MTIFGVKSILTPSPAPHGSKCRNLFKIEFTSDLENLKIDHFFRIFGEFLSFENFDFEKHRYKYGNITKKYHYRPEIFRNGVFEVAEFDFR